MAGMSMVIPFLPFYIRELGITAQAEVERWSGYIFAGPFIVSFFITPVWGVLGDRFGKKKMVLRAVLGLAVSQVLIGFSGDVYQLFLFRMFQGFASGFIPASLALVSASSPKEKSGYAIGVLQTSIAAGGIIGPLMGGVIADFTSHRVVFFITAVLCLISSIFVMYYVKEPERIKSGNISPGVMENLKFSVKHDVLAVALISIMIAQMSISITQPGFALFIETLTENKAYLSTISGLLFGITGIAMAAASPWWGKKNDRKNSSKYLNIAMIGGIAALCAHSFIYSYYLLFPVRILLGICTGGMVPAFYSIINKNIPDDRKSGLMGIASSSTILGNMLGPLMYSSLVSFIGLRYVFSAAGILLFANLLFIRYKHL